jgi:cobalt-zinc-cadmium efflux system outer membrane protein
MSSRYWLPVIMIGNALAASAHAAPLTYAQALAAAQSAAPSLQARSLQAQSARAAAFAAGRLPDPKIGLSVEGFPVSGPNAGKPSQDDFADLRVGFSQDVPSRAKRGAQRDRAQTDITAADAAEAQTSREVRRGTTLAWINLYYAKRRLSALDELTASLEPLWKGAPSSVTSGDVRPAQALDADQMRADLDDRRDELQATAGRARAELARWTGDSQADVAGPTPTFDIDLSLLRASVDHLPELAVRDAVTAQADADVEMARADKRPDWGWDVGYQRRDPRFGDMVSVGVTMSLPIFGATRQDPIIAARATTTGQARAEREATRRDLVAQLDAGIADHVMHHDQWTRARDVLVPLAQRRADLETASYGAGRSNLSDVMQAFTTLANAQLTLLDREAAVVTDGARLVITYGSDRS